MVKLGAIPGVDGLDQQLAVLRPLLDLLALRLHHLLFQDAHYLETETAHRFSHRNTFNSVQGGLDQLSIIIPHVQS